MITLRSVAMFSFMTACLVGCEGGKIAGRVIPGAGNVVLVVDENDPRCKDEGLANVNVVIRRYMGEGQSGSIVASGVTEASGDFRFPLTNKDAERYELQVTATTPDKRISKGRIFIPAPGKQVLVVIRDAQ
ncbi:MAG: hypothetical protein U0573_15750 [Phycisphaerales bacterium]|nr:hypothetical protein [Planctomycetota bacterium]